MWFKLMERLEALMELGGTKKDIALLVAGGISLALSLAESRLGFLHLPFDIAWVAIILCGIPILADALIASLIVGEEFAAGEVAFIMQIGALLEDLTMNRAKAGIERLVKLTPQTARVVRG